MSTVFLVPVFFITALLYASVGFGGGSSYNALLALAGVDYRIMPVLALICNLIVVSGGTYRFSRSGYIHFRRVLPWIVTSVPAAWLGGRMDISEKFFVGLLGVSLLLAGFQLLFHPKKFDEIQISPPAAGNPFLPMGVGAALGFLAGIVGIGGGIFLAPVLYMLRWGSARVIAGTCSFFILVNSLSGLVGHITKIDDMALVAHLGEYWMLFPAVLIGGQAGSYMGALRFNPEILRVVTAILILYVAARLLFRWWGMS